MTKDKPPIDPKPYLIRLTREAGDGLLIVRSTDELLKECIEAINYLIVKDSNGHKRKTK